MQQTDTIQDQGNVVKGTRELEDGEELHRLGKVLLLEGNGKFIALVILLHWKVQSKTMESRTTENVNHGDRAKPSENKMLSGSQSVLKWGTVSSFSNNKQVETGSSDKTIRFKPITIAL